MSAWEKRILKETRDLAEHPPFGIKAVSEEVDVRRIKATIDGPEGSPFAGGVFKLDMVLPDEYPMRPPKVKFTTKIFHPNVDEEGHICLDTLRLAWTPAMGICHALQSIQVLMSAPNPDDPLDPAVGHLWKTNEAEARKRAEECTRQHAQERD